MASITTFLARDHAKSKELSSTLRAAILQEIERGTSWRKTTAIFKVSRGAVERTIKRFQIHNSLQSLPRSGKPKKLSVYARRVLIRAARRFPKSTYEALQDDYAPDVSIDTIRRVLRDANMRK